MLNHVAYAMFMEVAVAVVWKRAHPVLKKAGFVSHMVADIDALF